MPLFFLDLPARFMARGVVAAAAQGFEAGLIFS
jgi:hypothetical protein